MTVRRRGDFPSFRHVECKTGRKVVYIFIASSTGTGWLVDLKRRGMGNGKRTVSLQLANGLLCVRRFQIGGGGHDMCRIRHYTEGCCFRRRIYRGEC